MQLTFDDEVEAFRAEFVAFLDEHLPSEAEAAGERSRSTSHVPEWARRWQRMQFDHGWLLPGNPPEFGGRNAGILEQFVHRDVLARRRIYHAFNPYLCWGPPVKSGLRRCCFVPLAGLGRRTVGGVKVERPQRMRGRTTLTPARGAAC